MPSSACQKKNVAFAAFFAVSARTARSTLSSSSAESDVYKRQVHHWAYRYGIVDHHCPLLDLSLIHISEPTRLGMSAYALFCLSKKKRGIRRFLCSERAHSQIYTILFVGRVRCV